MAHTKPEKNFGTEADSRQKTEGGAADFSVEGAFEELFREGGIEERLQSERDDLFAFIYRSHCARRGLTVSEWSEYMMNVQTDPQLQYEAVRLFNCKLRLMRRIAEAGYREDLRLGELLEAVDRLAEARDEETFNRVFDQIKKE